MVENIDFKHKATDTDLELLRPSVIDLDLSYSPISDEGGYHDNSSTN